MRSVWSQSEGAIVKTSLQVSSSERIVSVEEREAHVLHGGRRRNRRGLSSAPTAGSAEGGLNRPLARTPIRSRLGGVHSLPDGLRQGRVGGRLCRGSWLGSGRSLGVGRGRLSGLLAGALAVVVVGVLTRLVLPQAPPKAISEQEVENRGNGEKRRRISRRKDGGDGEEVREEARPVRKSTSRTGNGIDGRSCASSHRRG